MSYSFQQSVPDKKMVHFHCQRKLDFGKILHLVGNIEELQNWQQSKAIRMEWSQGDHWKVSLPIKKDFEGIIEYKYIVSDEFLTFFEWDSGFNQKLYIREQGAQNLKSNKINPYQDNLMKRSGSGNLQNFYFASGSFLTEEDPIVQKQKKYKEKIRAENYLKVMTLNIWSHLDVRWTKRSKLIVKGIEDEQVDFVGLQEVMPYQREVLKADLTNYMYFGCSRSHDVNDEEIGILYRKDKFYKLEGGHIWYSKENKQADYGAKHPRMLTWALFQDLQQQDRKIGIITTQLDSHSQESRIHSSEVLSSLCEKFLQSCEVFVILGDFKAPENCPTLKNLFENNKLKNCRAEYDPENNDKQEGKKQYYKEKKMITFHNYEGENFPSDDLFIQDHIFYDGKSNYKLHNFRVLKDLKLAKKNKEVIYPSNHYPVVASLYKETDQF